MNAYFASRLLPGDCVHFTDIDEYGRIILVLGDRVRVRWDDDSVTDIYLEDAEGLELVSASDPLEQEKIVGQRLLEEAIDAEET